MNVNALLTQELQDLIDTDHCCLTGSGTTALTIAIMALGFPKGSEIIVPDFSCLAVPLSVMYAGAKPVFVDVRRGDYNIDPKLIAAMITDKTRAIIGVHTFGQFCDVVAIRKICNDHGIKFIEDFAQSFGGRRILEV